MKRIKKISTLIAFSFFIFTIQTPFASAQGIFTIESVRESATLRQAEFPGDKTEGIFEIDVRVFARDTDIFILDSFGPIDQTNNAGFVFEVTNTGTAFQGSMLASITNASITQKVANNTKYKIPKGTSAKFTLQLILTTQDEAAGKTFGMALQKMNYSTTENGTRRTYILPDDDVFKTNKIQIDGQTPQPTTLKLLTPNGGERWLINSIQRISWAPNPDSTDIVAYLEKRTGTTFSTLGSIVSSGKGSIMWLGDINQSGNFAAPGSEYYIRIVNPKTNQSDRSDAPFTLLPQESMSVAFTIGNSENQIFIETPQYIDLTWNAVGDTSCTLSIYNPNGGLVSEERVLLTGTKKRVYAPLPNKPNTNLPNKGTYTLAIIDCIGQSGSRTDAVVVNLIDNEQNPPIPKMTINGYSEYTVRAGEKIPEFVWSANLPTGTDTANYTYKTTASVNSSSLCPGVKNGSKALAGNSVSGTYTPTEVASNKRAGCEITFTYSVQHKRTKQTYTANAVLKYVGESSGTNRNLLLIGDIQGAAANPQQTKTSGTLFTGTDAFIRVSGSLPQNHLDGASYLVIINDGSTEKTVSATLRKTSSVIDGKRIESNTLTFTTPGNIALRADVRIAVEYKNIRSNAQTVRVTCGSVCPGGPEVNPQPSTAPTAQILIGGKPQHTVKTGERVPVFTWNSTNGTSFKTTTSVGTPSACKGIVNGSKALAGNSVSGTYTPTEVATTHREGCTLAFTYEVKNASGQIATSTAQLIYSSNAPSNPILNNTSSNSSPQLPPTNTTPTTIRNTSQTSTTDATTQTSNQTTPAVGSLAPTLSSLSKTTAKPGDRILITGTNILTSGANNIDFVRKSDGARYTFSQSQKGGKTTAIFFTIPTTIQGQPLAAGEYTIVLRTIYGTSNVLNLTIELATPTTSALIPITSQGQFGEGVMFAQYALQQAGFFHEEITGYFGNITRAAVKAFQREHALENIGAVGPRTAELLNKVLVE